MRADAAREFGRGNRAPRVRHDFVSAEIGLGHSDVARKELDDWRRDAQRVLSAYQRFTGFSRLAPALYARLGKVEEAVDILRENSANGLHTPINPRYDSDFALIRGDPRFQAVMDQAEGWAKAQPEPTVL